MKAWNFIKIDIDKVFGFSNIGEEFKDSPISSLAKEICQNSLDTKFNELYKEKGNGEKIKIEFKSFYLERDKFPNVEDFNSILKQEYEFNKRLYKNDDSVPNFYKNAINCLKKDKIACLRISDFNTSGLLGSDKTDNSPWCNLTKNDGVSDKPMGSGGSKGKGKTASFVCSSLYTVFYSTYAMDELEASCGVSRLSGCKLQDGSTIIGEGYFENDNNPIKEQIDFDSSFTRDTYGTDIYIMGFKNIASEWKNQIIASVINNFLVAIFKDELEVVVEDTRVAKDTISELIADENINNLLEDITKKNHQIMVADDDALVIRNFTMFEENDVHLRLKINSDNDLSTINRVTVVRSTGMKILDLKNLPRIGFYSGILELKGIQVNDYFRKLENVEHNNWSSERADNPKKAEEQIKKLKDFVRDTIRTCLINLELDEVDAEGVGEYLPDEDIADDTSREKSESVEDEHVTAVSIIRTKKLVDTPRSETTKKSEEDVVPTDDGGVIEPVVIPSPEPQPPTPPNPNPIPNYFKEASIPIEAKKLRTIGNNGKYNIIFQSKNNYDVVKFEFGIFGELGTESIDIKKATAKITNRILSLSRVTISKHNNAIIIKNVSARDIYMIEVEFESDETWALEVRTYGNK